MVNQIGSGDKYSQSLDHNDQLYQKVLGLNSELGNFDSGLVRIIEAQNSTPIKNERNAKEQLDRIKNATLFKRDYKQKQIRVIDSDKSIFDLNANGQVEDSEAADFIMKKIRGETENTLEQLSVYYAYTDTMSNFIEALDKNQDAVISDAEVIQSVLARREGSGSQGTISNAIHAGATSLNENKTLINSLINNTDYDSNDLGVLNDQETLEGIVAARQSEDSLITSIVNEILSGNANKATIEGLLNQVDTQSNGVIDDNEVYNILRLEKRGNITAENYSDLQPALNLNENFTNLIDNFNNSLPLQYFTTEHIDAHQLLARKVYQAELMKPDINDGFEDPSLMMYIEELAAIYGDSFISEDPNSPDYFKMDGITGAIQDSLLQAGFTMDQLINSEASISDIRTLNQSLKDTVNNLSIQNGLPDLGRLSTAAYSTFSDLKSDLISGNSNLSLAEVLQNLTADYGDTGLAGEEFTGFVGAIQVGLNKLGLDTMDTNQVASLNDFRQLENIFKDILSINEDSNQEVKDYIGNLETMGELDVLQAGTGVLTENKMINSVLIARHLAGVSGDNLFSELDLDLTVQQKQNIVDKLNSNVTNKNFDINGDGVVDRSDSDVMTKYLSGEENKDKIVGDILSSYEYSSSQHLEVLLLLEDSQDKATLGSDSPSLKFVLDSIADIYQDHDGFNAYNRFSSDLADTLTAAGFDINDNTKPLENFDLEFIKNEIQKATGILDDIDVHTTSHETVSDLINNKVAAFELNGGLNQSLAGILAEIATVYQDSGTPGDINDPFTGFTGAITNGVDNFDVYDTNGNVSLEALKAIQERVDDLVNPVVLDQSVLPEMAKYDDVFSFTIETLEDAIFSTSGDSTMTINDFSNEVINIWGDLSYASTLLQTLNNNGYSDDVSQGAFTMINKDHLNLLLSQINADTNGYDLSYTDASNEKTAYFNVEGLKSVKEFIHNSFVDENGNALTGTNIQGVLAEMATVFGESYSFENPGHSASGKMVEALINSLNENSIDLNNTNALTINTVNLLYEQIDEVMTMYLSNGLVEDAGIIQTPGIGAENSSVKDLTALARLDEYLDQAILGGSNIGSLSQQNMTGLMLEIANIYQIDTNGGLNSWGGVPGQLRDSLQAEGINLMDLESLTHFDIELVKRKLENITEVNYGLTPNDANHSAVSLLINDKKDTLIANGTLNQTLPELLEEISQIYGDFGEPGSQVPWQQYQGFTGAIAMGLFEFDIYDTNDQVDMHVLNSLFNSLDRVTNPQQVSDDLLPDMESYNNSFNSAIQSYEELVLSSATGGDSAQTLSAFMSELAGHWSNLDFTDSFETALRNAGFGSDLSDPSTALKDAHFDEFFTFLNSETNNYNFDYTANSNPAFSLNEQASEAVSALNTLISNGQDPSRNIPAVLADLADIFGDTGVAGNMNNPFTGFTGFIQDALTADGLDTFDSGVEITDDQLANLATRFTSLQLFYDDKTML